MTTTTSYFPAALPTALLASIQSRRFSKNMLQAAKALHIVSSDRQQRLTDSEWNQTLKAIDQAHPGWKLPQEVGCSHDLCFYHDAA